MILVWAWAALTALFVFLAGQGRLPAAVVNVCSVALLGALLVLAWWWVATFPTHAG